MPHPLDGLDALQARTILSTMGQYGNPPPRGALRVNVGTNPLLDAIVQAHLRHLDELRDLSTFKLVVGPYGGGKSQFLLALREHAFRLGFPVAYVDLAPDKGAFDDMTTIYARIARAISLPPDDEATRPHDGGLPTLLRMWVERRLESVRPGELRQWVEDEVDRTPLPSLSYGHAVSALLVSVIENSRDDEALLAAWLRGERPTGEDRRRLAELGVREQLERATAPSWLYSLARLLEVLGLPGLVVLFDEMERVMSLPRRRRAQVADNLRSLIDDTARGELPGTFVAYAVNPEFFEQYVEGYPALAQRLDRRYVASARVPEPTVVDLDRLPVSNLDLLRELGHRLVDLAVLAWGPETINPELQATNIDRLAAAFDRSIQGAAERRAYVKTVYQVLLEQRQEPSLLTDDEIARLVGFAAAPAGEALQAEASDIPFDDEDNAIDFPDPTAGRRDHWLDDDPFGDEP